MQFRPVNIQRVDLGYVLILKFEIVVKTKTKNLAKTGTGQFVQMGRTSRKSPKCKCIRSIKLF